MVMKFQILLILTLKFIYVLPRIIFVDLLILFLSKLT